MEDLEGLRKPLSTLKKIQSDGYNLNTESTSSLFESLGINFDELSDQFDSQFEQKLQLQPKNCGFKQMVDY